MLRRSWFLWMAVFAVAGHAATKPPATYDYYSSGQLDAPRPQATESGLMLLGGGDWPVPAFRWFVEKMGHGRLVILRASYGDEIAEDFRKEIGGATSVETLVFHSRAAASDHACSTSSAAPTASSSVVATSLTT
jgi:hypothetical protein